MSIASLYSGFVDELAATVEPLLSGSRRRPPVTLVERGGEYEFYRQGRRGPTLLARGALGSFAHDKMPREALSQPVEVRLDADRILNKVLYLPAASRAYLDAVVAHQVERTTPWQADRVVFDYVLAEGAQAGDEQIAVRLVATSREMLETSMDRLAAAGIKPVLVGTSDDPLDQASPVNLLRDGQGDRRGSLRRRIGIGLAAIALLGAAGSAWAGWHLHQLESELVATGEQIRVTRTAIEAATARTEESAGYAKLLTQKKNAVPTVVLVDQLSQAIPTSTYLAQLVFGGEELRIAGFSSDPSALIGILEGAEALADVRFAAPTVMGEGESQDRFEIIAKVIPPGVATQ
jgi:general secretion pathway protein L